MTYKEFKQRFPVGSTVASPEGTYAGQCVSYVRQYMAMVHGVKTGPLGNAIDFAKSAKFLTHYQKVNSPKVGDIMVWSDDPGSWTSKYGHIAIYDGYGYMMNQNYANSLAVSRNRTFEPGFIGFYRLKSKEDDMYNGHTAKYWHDEYVKAKAERNTYARIAIEFKKLAGKFFTK